MIPDIVDPETGEVLNDRYEFDAPGLVTRSTALESRAEVEPLEALQQRRRDLIKRNDRLIALHGSFGLFADRRKQRTEAAKVAAKLELDKKGEKTPEHIIEANAWASPEIERYMDTALEEKIAWIHLDNELKEIEEKIRARDQGIGEHIKQLGLQR